MKRDKAKHYWKWGGLGFALLFLLAVRLPSLAEPPQDSLLENGYDRATRDRVMRETVRPLLIQMCGECHQGEALKGDFSLDRLIDSNDFYSNHAAWDLVISQLREGIMPPEEAMQPTPQQRDSLIAWLAAAREDRLAEGDANPRSSTLRRLNKIEYRNTIRDLLGVDYAPADDFPADDSGYGFDNNGDVLSIPPVLMEKYLDAAEAITALAIDTFQFEPLNERILGSDMELPENAFSAGDGSSILVSDSSMTFDFTFPYDGEYELRIAAYGEQAGGEPVKMRARLDRRQLARFEVPNSEDDVRLFNATTSVEEGEHRISLSFLNDHYDPENADPENRDRNLIISYVDILGPLDYAPPEKPETHRRIFFVEPSEDLPPLEAAQRILHRLASRAYRREITDDELNRLLALFEAEQARGASFEEGVQLAVQAVLISPHFLFRVEPEPSQTALPYRPLNDYELASRLSYFLWSSMPDEALFELAKEGKLQEGEQLAQQARRMLADPKSEQGAQNFCEQWLQIRGLENAAPDAQLFPEFDETLREAMHKESILFFNYILQNNRSLFELIDADYTFLNEPLAKHYGIEGVVGEEFRRVPVEGTLRGGVLTQASILTATSNPTRTSVVQRGYWILANLLGEPPPPPAADAAPLAEGNAAAGTMREQLERHRADPNCASCHNKMDPLGYALENFDAIGAFREREGGIPIDARGEMPDGTSFDGVDEMRAMLLGARRDDFIRCLAEKLLIYALGRGLNGADTPAIQEIIQKTEANDFQLSAMLLAIIESDPFTRRYREASAP